MPTMRPLLLPPPSLPCPILTPLDLTWLVSQLLDFPSTTLESLESQPSTTLESLESQLSTTLLPQLPQSLPPPPQLPQPLPPPPQLPLSLLPPPLSLRPPPSP